MPIGLTGAQPIWIVDNASFNLGMQSRHMLVIKRYFAADKDIENDTKAPNVNLRPCIRLCVEKLRCGKVERATKRLKMCGRIIKVGETEIDYFYVSGLGNENVLNFKV